jgi:ATP-dependent helicase/nuclease subunit B
MASRAPETPMPEPGLVEQSLAPDHALWQRVAGEFLALVRPSDWLVIVPSAAHGGLMRAALAAHAVSQSRTERLPQIATLSQLARSYSSDALGARSDSVRLVELFGALKASEWLGRHLEFGTQALWAMARQLIGLCDELTLGLGGGASRALAVPIEARILAAIKGTYKDRAWEACSAEAQLVLEVWRATLSREDSAALLLRSLERLAREASAPLFVVRSAPWLPYESAFYGAYAARQRVECRQADLAQALAHYPALDAAWPELAERTARPLRERAGELAATGQALSHVHLGACNNLEEQATRAAQQVLDWRAQGRERIGVMALDRVAARRVRALLERAAVLVRDEAGWKFSTTAVAGALMRWLELAGVDEAQVDTDVLLDWLKSPHAFYEHPGKAHALADIEQAIRDQQVLRGLGPVASALARLRAPGDAKSGAGPDVAVAIAMIASLRQWVATRPGRATLSTYFEWLLETLRLTGMRDSFARDAGGTELIALIAKLGTESRAHDRAQRFGFSEWRDFLADALENATFRDDSIESPISIVDFSGAALRDFDGVILLGADAERLPVRQEQALFLTPSLRVQLGLRQRDDELRTQHQQLALVLAMTPAVLATWQGFVEGEKRGPANTLARLSLIHQAAFGDSLHRDWIWPVESYLPHPIRAPEPRAPGLLPDRLTASQYASLTKCPYQYYVRVMLRLSALDDLTEDASQRDYGVVVHRILERFHALPTDEGRALLLQRLGATSSQVFDEMVGERPAFLGFRQRWRGVIEPYVDWLIAHRDKGWSIEHTELPCEVALELGDGRTLTLAGRLDRVDRAPQGMTILDYKARSAPTLRRALAEAGEDVQLPFYRLLRPDATQVVAAYLSVDKDEVRELEPPQPLEELSAAVRERIRSDFTRIGNGTPLPALGIERVCKYCDARGLCRKGQWSTPVDAPAANPVGAAPGAVP